jgi:hypothetical protein
MPVFWDAHVHIHSVFDPDALLDAALENFDRAAARVGADGDRDAVLMLSESAGQDAFGAWSRRADGESGEGAGRWRFFRTEEPCALSARNAANRTLHLVAGRQIVSAEGIEVLSPGCADIVEDRVLPLAELAREVARRGGLPVLPWGVGKWLGKRGREVRRFVEASPDFAFALGDNGNRPFFWPEPSLLVAARRQSIPVVSGSDPLPLADHSRRAGSFGGWSADGRLDERRPMRSLRNLFADPGNLRPFGQAAGFFRFFRDQLRIQARNRLRIGS